jgi:hypothetical protein
MAIDLNSQEMMLLLRQFEKGNAVLFAGAGFSIGAESRTGMDPPLGDSEQYTVFGCFTGLFQFS